MTSIGLPRTDRPISSGRSIATSVMSSISASVGAMVVVVVDVVLVVVVVDVVLVDVVVAGSVDVVVDVVAGAAGVSELHADSETAPRPITVATTRARDLMPSA